MTAKNYSKKKKSVFIWNSLIELTMHFCYCIFLCVKQ